MYIKCEHCGKDFYIRPGDYKKGKYKCCSRKCSFKNKNRKKITGKNHHNWKGELAGYAAIHIFVRSRKSNPGKCERCGKITDFLDLANISQKYKRDLDDWEYLCRKCHMNCDGRMKNFLENAYIPVVTGKKVKCYICGNNIYRMQSQLKYKHSFCSHKCLGIYQKGKTNKDR